jgi:hypothetical protein
MNRSALWLAIMGRLKRIRGYFGTWKAIEVSADSVADYIEELREDDYTNATINRDSTFETGLRSGDD